MSAANEPLPASEAYRLWAPTYEAENGMTALDQCAVQRLSPPRFECLLDAGCGTGRRLPEGRRAAGVDLVLEMLVAGRRPRGLLNADMTRLPFAPETFDLVWCRLALGHVPDLWRPYHELARVCRPGGCLVLTDVHPSARYRRTFRDGCGDTHEVRHETHALESHRTAADRAGLHVERIEELVVGEEIRSFFVDRGAAGLEHYEREKGKPRAHSEDKDFLLDIEPTVTHYEVLAKPRSVS
jgi:malonyl-CoA O-methyltransferase